VFWLTFKQDIYARKYFPQNIPAKKLTHLIYAFADIKADGTVFFTDTWADTDIHYPGDSWSDSGNNVYGAVKQMNLLKKANRNLKILLSIGGWTYTNTNKHMDGPASTAIGRKAFADSCVNMIKNYGFDGIDLDWEYPQNPTQGAQMLAVLQATRQAMDAYADTLVYRNSNGLVERPYFELSIAAPAGAENYKNLPLRDLANILDYINLMVSRPDILKLDQVNPANIIYTGLRLCRIMGPIHWPRTEPITLQDEPQKHTIQHIRGCKRISRCRCTRVEAESGNATVRPRVHKHCRSWPTLQRHWARDVGSRSLRLARPATAWLHGIL
jgi:hypothetical protein